MFPGCEPSSFFLRLMQTPSCGACMLGMQQRNSHGLLKSYGERGTAWPLSQGENASTLALTGFYWLSNSIHQRRFSFSMHKFALDDYFLQVTKERMILIMSCRLTRKKCCKCKGMIRLIGLVTLQSLGELAQTSGTQGWWSFSKRKSQSSLDIMQVWFPTGEPICGFGILHDTTHLWAFS